MWENAPLLSTGDLAMLVGINDPLIGQGRPFDSVTLADGDCAWADDPFAGNEWGGMYGDSDLPFRQMSEPAKIKDFPKKEDAPGEIWRQLSEPIKISIPTCAATVEPSATATSAAFAPEFDDVHIPSCGAVARETCVGKGPVLGVPKRVDSCDASPGSTKTSSTPAPLAVKDDCDDPLEPQWVGVEKRLANAVQGPSLSQGPISAFMYNLPSEYDEQLVLQELEDAAFYRNRDFKRVRFMQKNGLGLCVIHFTDPGVTRAFLASFTDRPLLNGFGTFSVMPLPQGRDAAKRILGMLIAATLPRCAGG